MLKKKARGNLVNYFGRNFNSCMYVNSDTHERINTCLAMCGMSSNENAIRAVPRYFFIIKPDESARYGVWKSSAVKNSDLAQLVRPVAEKNDHSSCRIKIAIAWHRTRLTRPHTYARPHTRADSPVN